MARVTGGGSPQGSEEIVEQPVAQMIEETMYVAVGKEVKECKSNLLWALQNSGGKKISIVHVHQPAQMIPLMGTKFPASTMKEKELMAYREIERQDMEKTLDEYLQICQKTGARAEKHFVENESIENGIVELISQHGIKKLVMGAAANKRYSKKMKEIKSKKANYVRLKAPPYCHIWFICKGFLIYTREAMLYGEARSLPLLPRPNTKTDWPLLWRSQSTILKHSHFSSQDNRIFGRVLSNLPDLHDTKFTSQSSSDGSGSGEPHASVEPASPQGREGHTNVDEWDALPSSCQSSSNSMSPSVLYEEAKSFPLPPRPNSKTDQPYWRSRSTTLVHSRFASQDKTTSRRVFSNPPDLHDVKLTSQSLPDGSGSGELDASVEPASPQDRDGHRYIDEWDAAPRNSFQSSRNSTSSSIGVADEYLSPSMLKDVRIAGSELSEPPPSILDGSIGDDLCDQLRRAMEEADNLRRDAFEEAVRRAKAEKDALDALRWARSSENMYSEELRLRMELEEALENEKDRIAKIRVQLHEASEELRKAQELNSLLDSQLAESHKTEKEFEQKIVSAVELLQKYKNEMDTLRIEHDSALKQAEELRKSKTESPGSYIPLFFSEFSFFEIEEATHQFDPSLKIGEGGYGSIYKGLLRQTQVAIKRLNPRSLQGPSEFQQEVEVLSRLRHPNLITLIGTCPEAWTLIYEYLSNGSLEDRLGCKNNTPPLSWQTRICIATGLCSVLVFLHSCKPQSIVHGDLKPSNILLDENFVCKLSDFGISRLITLEASSGDNRTVCCRTDPKGTFIYMDPEFLATGELTPKSDVYSFGIILLQLLTGRPALGITKEVQHAIDKGELENILDPLAGDWPFVQADQLARLALRCTEISRKNRPDIVSDVWKVLEPMKASCGGSSASSWGSDEGFQPPSYFICPIFQEVMQDPHVAADGFTYEAEAIRGWVDSGKETSPMTNAKLAHHKFIPNHALRSAIQEWLESR